MFRFNAPIRVLLLAAVVGPVGLTVEVSPALATHLTSLSLGPSSQSVGPGGSVTYSGTVGTAIACRGPSAYGFSLSATGAPAGSTVTLTPSSAPPNGPLSVPFTLAIAVPASAALGSYTITVTATFSASGCVSGTRTATVTLNVVDTTAPVVSCDLGVNPSGKSTPNANAGFRQVSAAGQHQRHVARYHRRCVHFGPAREWRLHQANPCSRQRGLRRSPRPRRAGSPDHD
jgi:hypothetical protein